MGVEVSNSVCQRLHRGWNSDGDSRYVPPWLDEALDSSWYSYGRDMRILQMGQKDDNDDTERMEDGGWRMEDGGWRMEDGGWRMEDGGWRMEDGGWRMEDGGWISAGFAQRKGFLNSVK
jgi:hypothetical protein